EEGRRAGAELVEQRRLVGLGGLEMAQLDVAEAADLLGDGGEADRNVVVVGIELAEHLLEQRLVVAHERAFRAALDRIAERVQRGAAQELEFRQGAEQREDPGPNVIFRGSPVALSRRASSGGARCTWRRRLSPPSSLFTCLRKESSA